MAGELTPSEGTAWEEALAPRVRLIEGRGFPNGPLGPFLREELSAKVDAVKRTFAEAERADLVGKAEILTVIGSDGTPDEHWIHVPPRKCGFVSADGRLVVVEPKLQGVNWLGLLALANKWGDIPAADLAGDDHPDFVLLIVEAYARSLEALTEKGLRRWFDEREETLNGRVRGRLMLGRYTQQCAAGRPDRAPCRFPVLDFDNLPNRTLRWALHLARRLLDAAAACGPSVNFIRDELDARMAAVDARFDGVPQGRLTVGDLRPLEKLPASFDHYRPALSLARLLIERLVLVDELGGTRSMSFVYSMPDLFEDAMEAALGEDWQVQFKHPYAIEGNETRTGTFRPDFWHTTRPAIIDAKWKYAFEPGCSAGASSTDGPAMGEASDQLSDLDEALGVRLTQIRHADVFQLVTYCHIRGALAGDGRVAKGLLIYPVENAADRVEPTRLVLARPPHRTVEVALMPWPIGRSATRSIWESVGVLRGAVADFLEDPASPTA